MPPKKQSLSTLDNHLHFNSKTTSIPRVHSLRKITQDKPTFKPDIHELPFEIYPQRTKTQVSRQQIVQRLISDRRERAQSLRNAKVRKEEEQYGQYCTFQPVISCQSRKMAAKETRSVKETHVRLYEEGLSKLKNTHECTHLTTEEDKENCTFRPNVHLNRDHAKMSNNDGTMAPIYQRLEQIIQEKKENRKRLQEEKELKQTRERPDISQKSKQIIENKGDFKKNVLQRLFSYMREKNDRMEKRAEQKEVQIQKQCTFKPNVNYYSSNSIEESNFVERQEKQAQKVKQRKLQLLNQDQAPFHPSINKLSALLVQSQRADQTSLDKIDRLHYEPYLERKAELEKIQESIYRECTFQPSINPLSRALQGAPHNHKCSCEPKEEHYQFHPVINPKSRQMAMKAKPKQTGLAVEQARLELQYKQMKQCTFRPQTLTTKYRSANQKTCLKNIPGADSYQQRIEKVKAKKRQEEELRSKLFEIEKRYVERRQTKPEPFRLSAVPGKMGKLKEEAEEEFRRQHPFRPEIIDKCRG